MYIAAVLSSTSSELLKWIVRRILGLEQYGFVFQTQQGQELHHHMTINLEEFDEKLNNPDILWHPVELHIDKLYYNDTLGVCAASIVIARAKMIDPVGPGHY
jgi:hypothetical protein